MFKYIKKELKKGVELERVKRALMDKGWCEITIEKALQNAEIEPFLRNRN